MIDKSEIIKQAKHYYGKNRKFIKECILSNDFNGKKYENWESDFKSIIRNPIDIHYGIFDDVILWIRGNKVNEINWNWIGDLSWTIDILLNKGIENGLDWDIKLAAKCNGTVKYFTVFISDAIPCFTYDCHYMTYNKKDNYYEFGPISNFTMEEKCIVNTVKKHLQKKGMLYLNRKFCEQRFEELVSDTNEKGNATLFDVLFKDTTFYQTEIKRTSIKIMVEKSGVEFGWTEFYDKNKILKERIEYRYFKSGDNIKTVFDKNGQIKNVEVIRKQIGRKKNQKFILDVIDSSKIKAKIKS